MEAKNLTNLNPMTEELTYKDMSSKDIKVPYTIPNKILMAPGYWNETHYSPQEVQKAFNNTDWSDKDNVSLILDHEDNSVKNWVGWIKNPRMDGENIVGDLELWDEDTVNKLVNAKAKFGISPKVVGVETDNNELIDFSYKNFSVVTNPAVKKAYINLMEKKNQQKETIDENKLVGYISDMYNVDSKKASEVLRQLKTGEKKLKGFEEIRKDKGMSPEDFYAAPRDPSSSSALPIYDEEHVRNAMARFNQTDFKSQDEKKKAKKKIIQAAKKFGIDIEKFKKVGPELEDNSQKNEEGTSSDDSTKLNNGGKTMAENEEESKEKEEQKDTGEKEKEQEKEEPAQEEQKQPESQSSDEKKDDNSEKEESELSDSELANIAQKPDFSQFVKKMREKDSSMSFKNIVKAYKQRQENLSQFENMNVKELTDHLEKILNVLKSKKNDVQENSQKESSQPKKLSEKKDAQSVQQESKELSEESTHTKGALAMAGMLKKFAGTGQSTTIK